MLLRQTGKLQRSLVENHCGDDVRQLVLVCVAVLNEFSHVSELFVDFLLILIMKSQTRAQTRKCAFDEENTKPVAANQAQLFGEGDFQKGAFSDQIIDRLVEDFFEARAASRVCVLVL